MQPDVLTVIRAAMEAPSGENAQPWRFHVDGAAIELRHHAESDRSLYNYSGYGTLVCEGAALENMLIAARGLGYEPQLELLPLDNPDVVARVFLGEKKQPDIESDSLSKNIPLRTTNRKKYSRTPLPPDVLLAFEKTKDFFDSSHIHLTRFTEQKAIKRLALVASTNERVMLGNKELHDFFFNHLTWTEKEDREKKAGFYIKTLELPPPVVALFRIFKNWNVMRLLKAVGFPVLVGKGNAATYASSAEIGIISIPDMSRASFLAAGRAFQRIWLIAVSHGLSAQPLTGTLFMNFFIQHVPEGHFSSQERKIISREAAVAREYCGGKGTPVVMYRMGYAPPASARAMRFNVEELLV